MPPHKSPLRLVLCTNGGTAGVEVLQALLGCEKVEVVGVVQSTRFRTKRQNALTGAFDFVSRCGLRYALYLAASTASSRFDGLSVPNAARVNRIPRYCTKDINAAESLAFLRRCQPEIVLSAFFNQRIGIDVTALAALGAFNIHPGALPRRKGVDPVFYAKLRGDPTLGVSVHRVIEELDAGPLIAQLELPNEIARSVYADTVSLYRKGAELFLEKCDTIGPQHFERTQTGVSTYDSWPNAVDVSALHARGSCLIRWSESRKAIF